MTTMTVTDFSKNLSKVFDRIQHNGEEIILMRNNHKIARLLSGAPELTAVEAMGDLYQTLADDAAKDWEKESKIAGGIVNEVRDPWDL